MGKKKDTGSLALGAELRRLRGNRTMSQIAELSRSKPFCDQIESVSAPTLCQIESGKTMPTLDTMHALATLYRVNPQTLYDLIVQGRIAERCDDLPATEDGLKSAFTEALREREWDRALSLALTGENRAEAIEQQLTWRANRAVCIEKQGMRTEAIALLQECANDPQFPEAHLSATYTNLSRMYALAGLHREAEGAARHAVDFVSADAPPADMARLALARALPALVQAQSGRGSHERSLREALHLLEKAAAELGSEDETLRTALDVGRANCHWRLGNALLASTEFTRIWGEVSESPGGSAAPAVWAAIAMGGLSRERRRMAEARTWFQRAEDLATRLEMFDHAFEATHELLTIARKTQAAPALLERLERKCARLFSMVDSRSPSALAYARSLRGLA